MSIYRSKSAKARSLALYNSQLAKLNVPFRDIYVDTSFGRSHIVETGNLSGEPLLVFHGGNSTTAYNLIMCDFLLKDFHIYAVDTIGHPGKSDEVCLSHRSYDYGKWASEVISGLGFDRIACFGGSYGGGILAKLMCVAPKKVKKAVLVVPSGINNALPLSTAAMLIPLILYRLTHKRKYLIKTALFIALHEDVLDEDTLDTLKDSFDNVKIKAGMPSDVETRRLKNYTAPTLVIAREDDCLFPARKVLFRAKRIFRSCRTIKLKGGHMSPMPEREKRRIIEFLKKA